MKMKISWSAYDRWKTCPHMFNIYHVLHEGYEIDRQKNRANTVYGSVVQEIFSRYYNDRIWLKSNPIEYIKETLLPKIWQFITKDIYIDWNDFEQTEEEVYNSIKKDIDEIIHLFEEKEMIQPKEFQRSEVKLSKRLVDHYFLTGKLDFLITLDGKRTLLDGKSTKDVDEDQLYFYSLIHKKIFGKYPEKIGFIFYREAELQIIDFDEKKIQKIESDIEDLINQIEENKFSGTPEEEKCSLCLFNETCEFSKAKQ